MISELAPARIGAALLILASCAPALRGGAETPHPANPAPPATDLRDAFQRASRCFVRIQVTSRPRWSVESQSEVATESFLSGILLGADGRIATLGDGLAEARSIAVETDGGVTSLAVVAGYDPQSGVGLLMIDPVELQLPKFGAREPASPGLPVFGIGDSFRLGPAMLPGYVAGVHRRLGAGERAFEWTNLIQLSMQLNPGDQGGPLVDSHGDVLGMLLTRYRPPMGEGEKIEPQGVSFALPIETVIQTADVIHSIWQDEMARKKPGAPRYARLGVRVYDIEDPVLRMQLGLDAGQGCLVESVFRKSPAEEAGIQVYDVLYRFDGKVLLGTPGFRECMRSAKPEQTIELEFIHAGKHQVKQIKLGGL